MTRRIVLSALSAVALLGCTLSDALAQARLRPIVQVEGDAVHLGDIIEGAGEAADIAVFGAPAPGASGMISAGRIIAAARDHGIFDLRTNGLTSVAVRRIGRTVGAEEIVQALRAAIVQQHRLPADIEIELSAGQMEATVEQAATGPLPGASRRPTPSRAAARSRWPRPGSWATSPTSCGRRCWPGRCSGARS
jgi:flagella basal body P-ring formation protein FlgA